MPIDIPNWINIRPQPENYLLDEGLLKAVEVAMTFRQPLLLTGEPGTGKTLLAYKVAHELHEKTKAAWIDGQTDVCRFAAEPLRFNTKTSTSARDLFYIYDAIGHFQHANIKQEDAGKARSTASFIELQALGKAIALANPQDDYANIFSWQAAGKPQSSVVLIDEIDKAPRDFTNDILNEIERYEFFIKEQDNFRVGMGKENTQRILLIMTSNSEKNLPDPFLRRCVFYHIDFPDEERLQKILLAQLTPGESEARQKNLQEVIRLFREIRRAAVRKPPATAELVAFVKMLEMDQLLDTDTDRHRQWYLNNLSLLVKTKEDIKAVREALK